MKVHGICALFFIMNVSLSATGNTMPVAAGDTIRLNFDTIKNFSLTIPPWQTVDLDHHSTYGIDNHFFPNDTVAKAFICFNPSAVVPPMSDSAILPHSGSKYGACFSAIPAPNNDWLISPKIHLQQHAQFSLWVKSYTDIYKGPEQYNILISLTDSAPSSFTSISGSQPLTAPTTWTQKVFDLTAYDNRDVYLAVQCVSNDHYIFMVDDIEIITATSGLLKAGFSANQTQINPGDKVTFLDASGGFPTSWQWSFPGGTPASSTLQNPQNIVYGNPGNYDVTLTVGNGSSTDTKTINGYISVGSYPSSAYLDFENLTDFTLNFSPWSTIDVKGGATYTIGGNITFPHSGQPMAYICFNPAATTPPEPFMKPHSGKRLGCCFSSILPKNPNNKWLISPRLTLGTNSKLDLWVMTYNTFYGLERYKIAVSTTDKNPSSFVYLTSDYETAPVDWTLRSYDLKAYNNATVYIGIQCVSDTAFIFMIDDISITSVAGVNDEKKDFGISVYPNPATDLLTINCDLPEGTPVTAKLIDIPGKEVKSAAYKNSMNAIVIDVSDLKPGVYSLILRTNGRQAVQKVLITR